MLLHNDKASRRKNYLQNVPCSSSLLNPQMHFIAIQFFFVHLTLCEQKHSPKYSKIHYFESIYSKDNLWQGQLKLSDLLQKSCVKVWKCDLSRKERFSSFSILCWYCASSRVKIQLTILRDGSKTPTTFKTEPFYSNGSLLEAVNYCSEYLL